MVTLSIQCFGVFRKFGDCLCVTVNTNASVLQIKKAIEDVIGEEHQALIAESVLANDNAILPNAYVLDDETMLSILPPVCGG